MIEIAHILSTTVRKSSAGGTADPEPRRVDPKEHQALYRCLLTGGGCGHAQGDQGCHVRQ